MVKSAFFTTNPVPLNTCFTGSLVEEYICPLIFHNGVDVASATTHGNKPLLPSLIQTSRGSSMRMFVKQHKPAKWILHQHAGTTIYCKITEQNVYLWKVWSK